jgi:hypothetical protein
MSQQLMALVQIGICSVRPQAGVGNEKLGAGG